MSFYNEILKYKNYNFEDYFQNIDDAVIKRILSKDRLNEYDFLSLLSQAAEKYLELMAQKAHRLTLQHFGRVIFLYTPMYLSNFCVNQCKYCGFNIKNNISRKKLTPEEVEEEAKAIALTGLKHLLILTGESRKETPVDYISECIKVLKKYFDSISIEIYPLETEEYAGLVSDGVDGMTVYQETYNEEVYDLMHEKGPKKNYRYRLDTPERACRAHMRTVNTGALLGLDDWRKEAFFTGLHANYLQDKYFDTEVSVSLPRLRPHIGQLGQFQPGCIVTDKNIVQIMAALRLFLPRSGITVSTRERAEFRNNILRIGVTKMSAGSSTSVGGHASSDRSDNQFEISDCRSVEEMKKMIYSMGYQPVFKDWHPLESTSTIFQHDAGGENSADEQYLQDN